MKSFRARIKSFFAESGGGLPLECNFIPPLAFSISLPSPLAPFDSGAAEATSRPGAHGIRARHPGAGWLRAAGVLVLSQLAGVLGL